MANNKTKKQSDDKKKYVSNLRLAEQAWLLSNLGVIKFQEKRGSMLTKTIRGLKLATESYISYWNKNAHKKENNDHIEDFIGNYFVGKDQELLYELMPHEISYLVPRIEVSKVYQDEKGNTYSVPYYFDYYTDESKVKDLSNGKIERVGEAGIQNIDIELLGGQPAEARRYVLAKMDIFMSSVDVLQQPAIHPSLRKEIQNKKTSSKEQRKMIPFYLDLFARTSKGGRVPFKLRLDIGWQIPELSENIFGNAKRAKRIANAIAKTNKTLWLHLKSHDLSFNQDGTLKVSIEYISSVEHELQRATLSAGNKKPITKENLKRANNILKKYKECVEKNKLKEHVDRDSHFWGTVNFLRSTDDKLEDEGRRQINAIKRMEGIIKGYQLTSIVDAGDLLSAIICTLDKNIYQTSVPAFELGVADGGDFETVSKGKEINLRLISAADIVQGRNEQPRAVLSVGECNSLRTALKNTRARLNKAINSKKTKQQKKAKEKVIKELTKQISAPGKGVNKSVITYKEAFIKANGIGKSVLESNPAVIKFFFFGDLIDALMRIVYQNAINQGKKEDIQMLNKFKIILGEVGIKTYEHRAGSFPLVSIRQELAKLPVSVNLFFGWLINTVYSKGRTEILLKDFLRNAILFLIPAISGQGPYFYPDVGQEKKGYHRPEISFFTNRVKESREIFTNTKTHQDFTRIDQVYKRITPKRMKEQNYVEPTIFAKGSDLFNYFYINVRNSAFESRVQNRFRDIRNGIYHFNIGSAKGFIKEVQFNKVDSPELEAALLEKENSAEIDQVRRIYNVSITMFGNASFFPGQMIYVDPRAIGLGSPSGDRTIAKALGLGGYYLITKVSSNLSSGKFETKLDTRWVAFGDGKKDNTVKSKKEVDKILKEKCTKIVLDSKVKKNSFLSIKYDTGTAKATNASLEKFVEKQKALTDEFQRLTGLKLGEE